MNYHTLPCGTVIPPSGIDAWVKDKASTCWTIDPIRIVAYHNSVIDIYGKKWYNYSLTDPTKPKKPKKTTAEIAFEKFGKGAKVRMEYWSVDRFFIINGLSEDKMFITGLDSSGDYDYWNFDDGTWEVVTTNPKKRLVTPMDLGGKWLKHKNANMRLLVIGVTSNSVYTRSDHFSSDGLETVFEGYSDTPTSEVRSF